MQFEACRYPASNNPRTFSCKVDYSMFVPRPPKVLPHRFLITIPEHSPSFRLRPDPFFFPSVLT